MIILPLILRLLPDQEVGLWNVMIGLNAMIYLLDFGFFQTLFVCICACAGFVVGKRIDEKEDLMNILDKLLPPSYHR